MKINKQVFIINFVIIFMLITLTCSLSFARYDSIGIIFHGNDYNLVSQGISFFSAQQDNLSSISVRYAEADEEMMNEEKYYNYTDEYEQDPNMINSPELEDEDILKIFPIEQDPNFVPPKDFEEYEE